MRNIKKKEPLFPRHIDKIIIKYMEKWKNHRNRCSMVSRLPELSQVYTAKQIWQRYHDRLKPGLCHEPLSDNERKYIIQEVRLNPNNISWKQLTLKMKDKFHKLRSENKVKNFWNYTKKSILSKRKNIHSNTNSMDILAEETLSYDFF